VLVDRFTVPAWRDYVVRFRPEFTGIVPAGIQMVLDADIPPEDLASIKALGTGAAPLDAAVQRAFEQRYGIPILQSYGATEFGGPVTSMTLELHAEWGKQKLGSVGRAFAGARLRVVDPDTDAELPRGAEGILEVMTPRMGDHWIRTSDIATIDADGFMFHCGRADGAIVRGGFKLLPETIERALMLHDAISAAAVTGIQDRRLGQVPAAVIQLRPGAAEPTIADLEVHLREHVLATHIPVHWRFVPDLPRTPSMKVDRPALRRLFDRLNC
jgi:acyl-coenzyme A synthetase/AMP-(fatty) acid ligase